LLSIDDTSRLGFVTVNFSLFEENMHLCKNNVNTGYEKCFTKNYDWASCTLSKPGDNTKVERVGDTSVGCADI